MLRKILCLSLIFVIAFTVYAQQPPAVPVAAPKNPGETKPKGDDKKEDGLPPVKVDEDQAILPLYLVTNKVNDLRIGTEVFISVTAVRVDGKRKLWLSPNALTGIKSEERSILLKRDI